MRKTRLFALIIAVLMLVSMLAACGGDKGPAEATAAQTTAGTTAADTTAADTTAADTTAGTTAPEIKTFDGYEFIIAGARGTSGNTFFVTSATSALTNQLIRAYEDLEDKLDIVITFADVGYDAVVANAVANKATADFIHFRHQDWIPLAVKGYIQPLNTDAIKAAGLDVSDGAVVDLYQTNVSKQLDNENIWAFNVSGKYFSAPWGHALAFNQKLCAGAGYSAETIYDLVRNNQWTWAKFEEICRAVSDPTTGIDGYSMLTNDTVEITSNIAINSLGADGKWTTNAETQPFKDAVEWVIKIWNDRDVCVAVDYEIGNAERRDNFYAGNQGFMVLWCGDFGFEDRKCNTAMVDDYGYVPFPMGPNATTYSHIIADHYGFSLETANKNVETSAYIMGQFCLTVNDPDEYETFARGFMRDDASVEMIVDYMLPYSTFNTARLSADTRQVVKEMVPEFLRATSSGAVCESFGQQMQAKINELFN